MLWIGIFAVVLCVAVAVIYLLCRKAQCPECGSAQHEVVEWVCKSCGTRLSARQVNVAHTGGHSGCPANHKYVAAVRRCECGHMWCDYPGIEIVEVKGD